MEKITNRLIRNAQNVKYACRALGNSIDELHSFFDKAEEELSSENNAWLDSILSDLDEWYELINNIADELNDEILETLSKKSEKK